MMRKIDDDQPAVLGTGLSQTLARDINEAWELMAEIGRRTADPAAGITRAAYGEGEQLAMQLVTSFAEANGLAANHDEFGNHYVVLPGTDAEAAAVVSGSHVDSVPNGGNFDGLAGCLAALAAVTAIKAAGLHTRRPLRAVVFRGEESPWFGTAYLGSRLMLGRSPWAQIGVLQRRDSGLTLAAHLAALGYQPEAAIVTGPNRFFCFLEMHIEQGPLLEGLGVPLGVATACRGNIRFPEARCRGAYGHSAALPRAYRKDAVLAVAELALALDAFWQQRVAGGDDNFVVTIGQFSTDNTQHAMTKVAGEVAFTLNLGGTDSTVMEAARDLVIATIARIEAERGVVFNLGGEVGTAPVALDAGLRALLLETAAASGIAAVVMPTVGHDAAMFALSKVPSGMLLIRNANGSHNPDESMDQADFALGVQVLTQAMLRAANEDAVNPAWQQLG